MVAALAIAALAGTLLAPLPGDTGCTDPCGPTVAAARVLGPSDTIARRPKAVEISDSYELRLRVHRYTAYLVPALFAVQYVAGQKLYDQYETGEAAPDWARSVHETNAWLLGGAFALNTVTGAWNLWDDRHTAEGRGLRIVHAVSMLAADGIFAYAGSMIDDDEGGGSNRSRHRSLALTGMGISLASGALMLLVDR